MFDKFYNQNIDANHGIYTCKRNSSDNDDEGLMKNITIIVLNIFPRDVILQV